MKLKPLFLLLFVTACSGQMVQEVSVSKDDSIVLNVDDLSSKIRVAYEDGELHIRISSTESDGYPAAHHVVKGKQIEQTTWIESKDTLILIIDEDGDGLPDKRFTRNLALETSKMENIKMTFEQVK